MSILASDISSSVPADLPERAADTPPILPESPIKYGKIAKKPHAPVFSALSASVRSLPMGQRFNRICFAFSAAASLTSAATTYIRRRGGHMGASRVTQRHQPGQPPAFCVDSAVSPLLPARHFSGWFAQSAIMISLYFLCVCSENGHIQVLPAPLLCKRRRGWGMRFWLLFSSLGVILFHRDSVVNPVLALV